MCHIIDLHNMSLHLILTPFSKHFRYWISFVKGYNRNCDHKEVFPTDASIEWSKCFFDGFFYGLIGHVSNGFFYCLFNAILDSVSDCIFEEIYCCVNIFCGHLKITMIVWIQYFRQQILWWFSLLYYKWIWLFLGSQADLSITLLFSKPLKNYLWVHKSSSVFQLECYFIYL